jgi:hypothetical protein
MRGQLGKTWKRLAFAFMCLSLAACLTGFIWLCIDMIQDARAQAAHMSRTINLVSPDERGDAVGEFRLTVLLIVAFVAATPLAIWFWWRHDGKYAASEKRRGSPAAAVPTIARLYHGRRHKSRGFQVLPPKK